MSDVIRTAISRLNEKVGSGFDGVARFDILDEGSILIDESGAREGDAEADVTLTADTETFRDILDGALDPASAFMNGRLKVDGDMSTAMKLGAAMT